MIGATIPELVERARCLAVTGERRLLGIVGAPGSGKSTLGDQVALVGMDGFHLDNPILEARGRRAAKGALDTFDVAGYVALLRRLSEATEPITYAPRFDRQIETSIGSAVPVPASVPLVVTDGLYLLLEEDGCDQIRPLLDEVWFLDLPDEERQSRLVRRRLGHGDNEEHALEWTMRVDQPNAELVRSSRHRADLIVHVKP